MPLPASGINRVADLLPCLPAIVGLVIVPVVLRTPSAVIASVVSAAAVAVTATTIVTVLKIITGAGLAGPPERAGATVCSARPVGAGLPRVPVATSTTRDD